MRCRSCDALIHREIKDPLTGTYSDLCGTCYRLSEYVREGVFTEPTEYAHQGAYEGLNRPKNLQDEG